PPHPPSTIYPSRTRTLNTKFRGATRSAAVPTDRGGKATCAINSLDVAGSPHSITAIYSGDSNYKASPASTASSQGVNQAGTTTSDRKSVEEVRRVERSCRVI